MRIRLSDATTRVKEVREFPIEVIGRPMRVGCVEGARSFKT
jgi:hypothetical protein